MYVCIHADIRKLYYQAGVENKPTVFLFTDTQVVEETFLEDINNILSSGEVPNLYKPDEFEEVHPQSYTAQLSTHLGIHCTYVFLILLVKTAFAKFYQSSNDTRLLLHDVSVRRRATTYKKRQCAKIGGCLEVPSLVICVCVVLFASIKNAMFPGLSFVHGSVML